MMEYSSTELRLSGDQMTITISNGYGQAFSATIDKDSNTHECMETISKLMYSAGYSFSNIRAAMLDEADRIEIEINNLKNEQ